MVPDTLKIFFKEFIDDQGNDKGLLFQCKFLRFDLKYIAKPALMPHLVQNTTMVEDLIEGVSQLHFQDAQKNSTEMEEFGDAATQFMFYFAHIELEMTSVLESKFLSCVNRSQDVARVIAYFKKKFEEIDILFKEVHSEEGFFLVPIHRLFTFLLTRVLMGYYAQRRLETTEESKEPPSTDFNKYLVSEGIVASS